MLRARMLNHRTDHTTSMDLHHQSPLGPLPASPRPLRSPSWRQFLTFALVGAFGTAAHYLVLAVLVELFGVRVLGATTAGFVCGAIVNYVLNRRYTFNSSARHAVALPKFLTVATLGASINWLVMALLTGVADLHYMLAQLLATATVLAWNFIANHAWTFRT